MKLTKNIPARTIERMVLYKRLLSDLLSKGQKTLFSHQLAALAHNTPAQVRRDIMTIGHEGSPHKGYDIASLISRITVILDGSKDRSIALVGVGNLAAVTIPAILNRKSRSLISMSESSRFRRGRRRRLPI